MEQTQIYLTNREHRAIAAIAERVGWIQSELIRKTHAGFVALYGEGKLPELLHGSWHVERP
jgi:hypothetical protein